MNKRILSLFIALITLAASLSAQATLPFVATDFNTTNFANNSFFVQKNSATWNNSDNGRVDLSKGGSFTFHYQGRPGVLSLEAHSSNFIGLAYNGKLRVEVSPDQNTWSVLENSASLNDSYASFTYSIPFETAYIRISNNTSSSTGNITYIRQFQLTDYDLSATVQTLTFPDTKGSNESSLTLRVQGKGIKENLTAQLTDGSQYGLSETSLRQDQVTAPDGSGAELTVYFRPLVLGDLKDTLLICNGTKDTLSIPLQGLAPSFQAILTTTAAFTPYSTSYLTPSTTQELHLNALHLVSPTVITMPSNFEVSVDGSEFFKQLSLSAESLNEQTNTTLYVRMNSVLVGHFNEKMKVFNTESRISEVEYALSGTIVKGVPTMVALPVPDRELIYGETLSALTLTGGKVTDDRGETLQGEFRWVYGENFTPAIGSTEMPIYFVPTNSYGYETVNGTIIVSVERQMQTLTWDQEFEAIEVGQELTFNASASSGLTVTYTANKPELLQITGNKAIALAAGRVRVIASQEGDNQFQPAEGIAYYLTINVPASVSTPAFNKVKVFWSDRSCNELWLIAESPFRYELYDALGIKINDSKQLLTTETIQLSDNRNKFFILKITDLNDNVETIKVIRGN